MYFNCLMIEPLILRNVLLVWLMCFVVVNLV